MNKARGVFNPQTIKTMPEDELREIALEIYMQNDENIKIIRKFQMQVDAQANQLKELSKEKESIAAKRDQLQMRLDVQINFTDDLLEKILKSRGYHD